MSIDAALAMLPEVLAEVRALRREVGELRAVVEGAGDSWVSPSAWARANTCSVDTAARKIAAGELETKELRRTPLFDKHGQPLLDKNGQPRFRRTLRVRLARPVSNAEIKTIAAEMRS